MLTVTDEMKSIRTKKPFEESNTVKKEKKQHIIECFNSKKYNVDDNVCMKRQWYLHGYSY